MCTEEYYCGPIELVVEGRAVEAWGIGAQDRHRFCKFRRARGDKGEMSGIGYRAIVGPSRKKLLQRVNRVWRHAIAAERRAP